MERLTITLRAMYQTNPTMFDGLAVTTHADKELLIETILHATDPFEALYPSADIMKEEIGRFSRINLLTWQKLEDTLYFEYNPTENYDRQEDSTVTTDSSVSADGTGEQQTSAYNTEDYTNLNKNTTGTQSTGKNTTGTASRIHGNIGVTTTQQMIAEERSIVQFNVYDFIAGQFVNEFCVRLY